VDSIATYSYIPAYIYVYTKGRLDEIPTGRIAFTKELLNMKHKIIYTVKTISVDM